MSIQKEIVFFKSELAFIRTRNNEFSMLLRDLEVTALEKFQETSGSLL
jgi:hypothetical protein